MTTPLDDEGGTRVSDPLTVAVQLDEIERHKLKLSLAVKHGYADNPDGFANRIRSDLTTRDAIEADAAEFAETIEAIRAVNRPPRTLATDPAQGLGVTPSGHRSPKDRFADLIFDHFA